MSAARPLENEDQKFVTEIFQSIIANTQMTMDTINLIFDMPSFAVWKAVLRCKGKGKNSEGVSTSSDFTPVR